LKKSILTYVLKGFENVSEGNLEEWLQQDVLTCCPLWLMHALSVQLQNTEVNKEWWG